LIRSHPTTPYKDEQSQDAERDREISKIGRAEQTDIQEVVDRAVANSIDEIAQRASKHKSGRQPQPPPPGTGDDSNADQADERQGDDTGL